VDREGAPLAVDQLRAEVADGRVDTVLVAFTDMQGRLQGKRLHAQYFLDEVLEHGTEGCNYLLAVDVDMSTVDGYAMSSWERGYGDFVFAPDLTTLRRVPWHPATVLLLAGLIGIFAAAEDAHRVIMDLGLARTTTRAVFELKLLLLLAIFVYGEPFTAAHAVAFPLIWMALAIITADAVHRQRRRVAT